MDIYIHIGIASGTGMLDSDPSVVLSVRALVSGPEQKYSE
jgi:hypothetical protein